jgi:hypothetical protein
VLMSVGRVHDVTDLCRLDAARVTPDHKCGSASILRIPPLGNLYAGKKPPLLANLVVPLRLPQLLDVCCR